MHETEIEPGDVERMARLLTLAAGVDPEAIDLLVTRMDPPARKWERYANQARALLTERDLAEEMAEVLEATEPEPCCEPEPSDRGLTVTNRLTFHEARTLRTMQETMCATGDEILVRALGKVLADYEVDLIEGQPYRVVDHGVVSIGTWDSKSLRFVTSRTGSGEPRTWAPLREVSEVTPLTPGVITDGLVDGVSQTYRQAYGAKKSAGPDYRPRDERLKQAAEAVLTHLGYRREQA